MTEKTLDEEIAGAWGRIFLTADGETALLHLRQVVTAMVAMDAPDCAVREMNGMRRFAHQLIGYATQPGQDDRDKLRADIAAARRRKRDAASAGSGSGRERRAAARRGEA